LRADDFNRSEFVRRIKEVAVNLDMDDDTSASKKTKPRNRIDVRFPPDELKMVDKAARIVKKNRSEFVRHSAVAVAKETFAGR
jgi:hypothetical protein